MRRHRLLLPAYLCDAVLAAAPERCHVEFYRVDGRLSPLPEDLSALAEADPGNTCLLVMQPFGFPFDRVASASVNAAAAAGVAVIEDRTHSLFSSACEPLSTTGAASLRKWMPLPDGGLLYGIAADADIDASPDMNFTTMRNSAMEAKGRWLGSGSGTKESFRASLREAEEWLDRQIDVRRMSHISEEYLASTDPQSIVNRRRANYRVLLEGLASVAGADPLFLELEDGVCPLGMPVFLVRRDEIREELSSRGIYCPIHWQLPPVIPQRFVAEHRLSKHVLTLPCDQRYSPSDMEFVVSALRKALGCH